MFSLKSDFFFFFMINKFTKLIILIYQHYWFRLLNLFRLDPIFHKMIDRVNLNLSKKPPLDVRILCHLIQVGRYQRGSQKP